MPLTIGGGLNFCGHDVTDSEWDLIQQITREFSGLAVTELAGTICELLEWKRPNGRLKTRECYLFLLNMRSRGWLPWLPETQAHPRRPHTFALDEESDPQAPLSGSLAQWAPVELELLDQPAQRQLFRQYIHRYHYLGYKVPYGAQLRYFVRSQQEPRPLLACLLFTSAAWKMAPRDAYIGWSAKVRPTNLPRVVNNARFLILPWVRIPHLASHILSRAARQLRVDWPRTYGVDPVLLETLVDRDRYPGTCYRAANWASVGFTTGRGRMDRFNNVNGPRKEIFLYPLERRWQRQLCEPPAEGSVAVAAGNREEDDEPAPTARACSSPAGQAAPSTRCSPSPVRRDGSVTRGDRPSRQALRPPVTVA